MQYGVMNMASKTCQIKVIHESTHLDAVPCHNKAVATIKFYHPDPYTQDELLVCKRHLEARRNWQGYGRYAFEED